MTGMLNFIMIGEGVSILDNYRRYKECLKIVSKIIKRRRRKNLLDKERMMSVVSANIIRHKLNHHCRRSLEVFGDNRKSIYIPTIKLQRGFGQFKIRDIDIDIRVEPYLTHRKDTDDEFLEALERWYKKLKEEVEKTTELNETTIKTPVNVMSDTSIMSYYDLKEYGSNNRTRFDINGDMNYEFNKEV